jgi:hypothetical protein
MLTARDIFAVLVAASGWHYLFFSGAARRLQAVEGPGNHRVRIMLRRFNGVMIIVMAVLFFAGSQPWMEQRPISYMCVWFGVMALLFFIIMGAFIDIRLTVKLKTQHQPAFKPSDDQL